LAAIATARILDFEFEEILQGLKNNFKLMAGRGNFINLDDVYILDHTYNATINSVSKACEALVQFKRFSKNLILVIGSLEDLGTTTKDVHMNIGYYISALPIDTVVTLGNDAALVGEGIRKINHNKKNIEHCEDINTLPDLIRKLIIPHTTILMIGGRSLNLSQHLKTLTDKLS
jgi:UDP-N-acetylmuramoyl-tripeptide--D-alanyl-D-alanine ligase